MTTPAATDAAAAGVATLAPTMAPLGAVPVGLTTIGPVNSTFVSYDDADGAVEHRISFATLLCIILSATLVALAVAWRNLRKVYELRRGGDLLSNMINDILGNSEGGEGGKAGGRMSIISTYLAGGGSLAGIE